jgi:D-beta-D-heptose 7-phosphate kinase/D-beta-D-heptose 1-phosphate adenosyltransferase
MRTSKKLINIEEASEIAKDLKERGKKIAFTNGCFDILHVGHIQLLERAKSFGDVLIVGLNSDDSIRRIKGEERPINPEEDRARVLKSLEVVDYVIIFNEDTPLETIKKLKPDILVKGGDWTPDNIVGRNIVESYGGKVKVVDLLENKSTTQILNKILSLKSNKMS